MKWKIPLIEWQVSGIDCPRPVIWLRVVSRFGFYPLRFAVDPGADLTTIPIPLARKAGSTLKSRKKTRVLRPGWWGERSAIAADFTSELAQNYLNGRVASSFPRHRCRTRRLAGKPMATSDRRAFSAHSPSASTTSTFSSVVGFGIAPPGTVSCFVSGRASRSPTPQKFPCKRGDDSRGDCIVSADKDLQVRIIFGCASIGQFECLECSEITLVLILSASKSNRLQCGDEVFVRYGSECSANTLHQSRSNENDVCVPVIVELFEGIPVTTQCKR